MSQNDNILKDRTPSNLKPPNTHTSSISPLWSHSAGSAWNPASPQWQGQLPCTVQVNDATEEEEEEEDEAFWMQHHGGKRESEGGCSQPTRARPQIT